MKHLIRITLALALTLSTSAFAQEARLGKTWVGGLAGLSFPGTANLDAGVSFGANAGHFFQEELSGGAYYHYFNNDGFKLSNYGLEGAFTILPALANLAVGAKVGFQSVSATVLGVTASDTELAFGPKVSFDIPLHPNVTVGGEGSLLVADGETLTNLFASLKYWF